MARRIARDRGLVLVACCACAAVAILVACGFPTVDFAADGSDGATTDAGTDISMDGPAADAFTDGAAGDAETRTDATQRVDEAGCKEPCDCDGDKFVNKSCLEAGADPKTADCDDFDPLRYPTKSTWTSELPPADNGGDWNCDNVVEMQYGTGLRCATSCGAQGFTGTPKCGEAADYVQCVGVGLCSAKKIETRKQGCR